jgi:hypothetical protein
MALSRALVWLEEVQRDDGGWPIRWRDAESDIVITALTGDLLRRAGRRRAFDRAATFLIAKQQPSGLWFFGSRNADAYNAIVIEVLEARLAAFPPPNHRLSLARDLFAKADELASEGEEVSDQIALITVHQAIEMFLYSALESLDPPQDIWEANGQRTIGLRSAVSKLDECLREATGVHLSCKSQVQMLASARDGIVHKGIVVARSTVRDHLSDAQKFLTATSQRTIGYDLLGS